MLKLMSLCRHKDHSIFFWCAIDWFVETEAYWRSRSRSNLPRNSNRKTMHGRQRVEAATNWLLILVLLCLNSSLTLMQQRGCQLHKAQKSNPFSKPAFFMVECMTYKFLIEPMYSSIQQYINGRYIAFDGRNDHLRERWMYSVHDGSDCQESNGSSTTTHPWQFLVLGLGIR